MNDLMPTEHHLRPIPEGGLEAVISAGRGRRRRAAAALGIVAVASAGSLLLLSGGGNGHASIAPAGPIGPTATAPAPVTDSSTLDTFATATSQDPSLPQERDGLVSQSVNPGTLAAGSTVTITQDECNGTAQPLVLDYPGGQQHDATVTGPTGVLWHWSTGRTFTTAPTETTIAAHTCVTWSSVWNGRDDTGQLVPAGTYTVQVEFVDADGSLHTEKAGSATVS